jgi:hypothetical protein
MGDGHHLFAKVYQSNEVMGRVQTVIPNTPPKAKQMVIMMNKTLPAYVGFSLQDQSLPELFLLELLNQSCCPTLVAEINSCLWDSDSRVLNTQQESNKNQHLDGLEKAAWFKNAFEDLGLVSKSGPKPLTPLLETLFNLDKDRSVKTIHHQHENRQPLVELTQTRKFGNESIKMMTSKDEGSTLSSCDEELHTAVPKGDGIGPSPSAGDNEMAPGATSGG